MESAIWGLLGTIVGALASIATRWLAGRSSYNLQRNKSNDERIERASVFQRQTLLDLQEAIHDTLRLVNRAHIEDQKAYSATKEWGKNMLSEEVDEGIRLATRRVAILSERLSDDTLRTHVKGLTLGAANSLLSKNVEDSFSRLRKINSDSGKIFENIGVVLRSHY